MATERDARRGLGPGTSEGQLLILAGIILTLAFLLTAITISEIEAEKANVVRDTQDSLRDEFSYLRREFGSTLNASLPAGATDATFRATFNDTKATYATLESSRGFEFHASLAGNDTIAPKTEWANFTRASNTLYRATSHEGAKSFDSFAYDGASDGIIHGDGGIQGAIVYLLLADASASYGEVLVYDVVS